MSIREDKLSGFSKILTGRETVIRFLDPIDAGAAIMRIHKYPDTLINASWAILSDFLGGCAGLSEIW